MCRPRSSSPTLVPFKTGKVLRNRVSFERPRLFCSVVCTQLFKNIQNNYMYRRWRRELVCEERNLECGRSKKERRKFPILTAMIKASARCLLGFVAGQQRGSCRWSSTITVLHCLHGPDVARCRLFSPSGPDKSAKRLTSCLNHPLAHKPTGVCTIKLRLVTGINYRTWSPSTCESVARNR